jgi:hypothetical protein
MANCKNEVNTALSTLTSLVRSEISALYGASPVPVLASFILSNINDIIIYVGPNYVQTNPSPPNCQGAYQTALQLKKQTYVLMPNLASLKNYINSVVRTNKPLRGATLNAYKSAVRGVATAFNLQKSFRFLY